MYSNKQITKYFNLAKNASVFSDYPKIHIGSVMVYKNKVLCVGYNTTHSHPLQKAYNIYRQNKIRVYNVDTMPNALHSEMSCLVSTKHLDLDWSKVSIFVYREYKDGTKAIAKPCRACTKALIDRGVRNIYYTTKNGWNYEYIEKENN